MTNFENVVKKINYFQTNKLKKIEPENGLIYAPLKCEDNKYGFLIYSTETLDNTENEDLKKLYKNYCKKIENMKERNVYRYYYYKKLDNNFSKHITIIMMNPAFADSEEPDDTIKNIEEYLNNGHNEFGSYDIINLYPIRMPKSAKLDEFLKQTKAGTEKYQNFVEEYLNIKNDNNIIVAAWGSNKKDNKVAKNLFTELNIKFYCYGLTKDRYPKHFGSLAYNNFNKFIRPLPYLKINNWLKETNLSDYDKTWRKDVKDLKQWLKISKPVSEYYVNYMNRLLRDVFDINI